MNTNALRMYKNVYNVMRLPIPHACYSLNHTINFSTGRRSNSN